MSKNKVQGDREHKPVPEDSKPLQSATAQVRSGKREIMLKPSWPGVFHRTVGTGDQAKRMAFPPNEPVEVTDEEFAALKPDIGIALFEIERDEKGRPRFVESVQEPVPTTAPAKPETERAGAENV